MAFASVTEIFRCQGNAQASVGACYLSAITKIGANNIDLIANFTVGVLPQGNLLLLTAMIEQPEPEEMSSPDILICGCVRKRQHRNLTDRR